MSSFLHWESCLTEGGFSGFSEGRVDVQQVSSGTVAVAFLQLATLGSPLCCHCSTAMCLVPECGSSAGSSKFSPQLLETGLVTAMMYGIKTYFQMG